MKKNDNRGSAFILVIIALALVTIFTGVIFKQINNQTKSNYKLSVDMHLKYAADSGIENTISKVIEEIIAKVNKNIEISNDKKEESIISDNYIEIPDNTYLFHEGYGFIVNNIPKVPIEISYLNNKPVLVKDISMTLVSIGIYKGEEYKVESEVIFKTKRLSNGNFEVRYFIDTYKRI